MGLLFTLLESYLEQYYDETIMPQVTWQKSTKSNERI